MLLITHYTRILRYVKPDFVHVFVGGRIVEEGGPELADSSRSRGYERYLAGAGPARAAEEAADDARLAIPAGMPQYDDMPRFDVEQVRADFPILDREVNGASAGLPRHRATPRRSRARSSRRCAEHYELHNANVARSVHTLGTEATEAYEGARAKVAAFIGAPTPDEVVFTKNSTEAINLVAYAFSAQPRRGGDPRFASARATRSSSPRWSTTPTSCRGSCCASAPARRCAGSASPTTGRLDESNLDELINERTKLVSIVHVSNILGTVNATARITAAGPRGRRAADARRLAVGAAPADGRGRTTTRTSSRSPGTRCCGPTGIGVLWGRARAARRDAAVPRRRSMIETVTMAGSTFAPPPARFEAGTPPIAEAVGLGAAVDYLSAIGMEAIAWHEKELTAYALDALSTVPGLRIFGPQVPVGRGGTISFDLGRHPPARRRAGARLAGVQVRVGHHCARPTCDAVRRGRR